MNVSFVTLPEKYLSKLRGVNQTCIVFCANNVDSLPELMSTNCPNGGGQRGRELPPDPPSRTAMYTRGGIHEWGHNLLRAYLHAGRYWALSLAHLKIRIHAFAKGQS